MGLLNKIANTFKVNFGSNEVIVDKASKGISKDSFYSQAFRPKEGTAAPENLNVLLDLFSKDPIVNAGITTRVNAILASGFTLNGKKRQTKDASNTLKRIGYNYSLQEKAVTNLLLYGHLFFEVVRTQSGNPAELHVLETTEMEIKHDNHGEIYQFIQRANNGEEITWTPEDIVYIKLSDVSSKVWGEIPVATLYRTLTTKNHIEKFINSLAITNAWRQVFKSNSLADEEIPSFLAYLRDAQADPSMPLVIKQSTASGVDDDKFEILRDPSDLKEFLGVLDYLRTQILMQLKVPPIMIGLPDSSNRSNSDSQIKAFNMENMSVRRKLEDAINDEMFKKLGITGVEFSWNPIDKRNEKDDVEIAEKLMNMGAKPKMIEQFLRNAGLEIPEGELFDKESSVLKKSDDLYESRKPADKDQMNNIGSGEDSSTREDQL